ncbi:hypothetical protein CYMTET_43180 [Cymbomonas tetramitiformis]|uniref:UBA domain-containing protein n=1 Tax=Cymbomonas tetramitiformis TaxID=36881 RepID=A0AAE0C2Q9_9CHLO|nr:hypothetical protein CYMTET_43180 [Cymbomonas tetramitiformis]
MDVVDLASDTDNEAEGEDNEQDLARLLEMGFDAGAAACALKAARGDVDHALECLLAGGAPEPASPQSDMPRAEAQSAQTTPPASAPALQAAARGMDAKVRDSSEVLGDDSAHALAGATSATLPAEEAAPGSSAVVLSFSEQLAAVRKQQARAYVARAPSPPFSHDAPSTSASPLEKGGEPVAIKASLVESGLPAAPLHVLSYNIWFDHEHTYPTRMAAIAQLADSGGGGARPALLALQEVTDPQSRLLRPALAKAGYHAPVEQETSAPYWVALSTRAPLEPLVGARTHEYTCGTMMGRALLLGRTVWPGVGVVVVGTSHLESFVGAEADVQVRRLRAAQLAEAGAVLCKEVRAHRCQLALLLGDMNWEDKKDGDALAVLGATWADAWQMCGRPPQSEHTYDGKQNAMLAHRFKNRFDRCFVWRPHAEVSGRDAGGAAKAAAADVTISKVALLGRTPLPGLFLDKPRGGRIVRVPLLPSDHFGLLTSLMPPGLAKEGVREAAEAMGPGARPLVPANRIKSTAPPAQGASAWRSVKRPAAEEAPLEPVAKQAATSVDRRAHGVASVDRRAHGVASSAMPGSHVGGEAAVALAALLRGGATKCREVQLPPPWRLVQGTLLVACFNGDYNAHAGGEPKVAGFDFDDTLCPRDFRVHGAEAWSHMYPHAPAVLRRLVQDGYAIVVASNESLDRLKNQAPIQKTLDQKCGRIARWAADVGVPVLALVATSKKDTVGSFHKAVGSGMWRFAAEALEVPSATDSFFVGDAAGRPADHGEDDKRFAKEAGLAFYNEKRFFEELHPKEGQE